MVFWGWFLAPMVMILSVPMISLVRIALESDQDTRGLALMLEPGIVVLPVKI